MRYFKSIFWISVSILILFIGCKKKEKIAPANIVATYTGGELTREDLEKAVEENVFKREPHEECRESLINVEVYKAIIRGIVVDKMIEKWIKEKKLGEREEVKDGFKHLDEEVNLSELHLSMHEDRIKADEVEIQEYYESHRDKYKDKPLNEVKHEIKHIIEEEKCKEFVPQYIEELKANAVIQKNYDFLKVEEPTEEDLRAYYEENKDKFIDKEKVKIQQIEIKGVDKTSETKAEDALIKLRSGADFGEVAKQFSEGEFTHQEGMVPYYIEKGDRGNKFDEVVFSIYPGELSKTFKSRGSFYIVKLLEKLNERQKKFYEVREEIREEVRWKKEKELFEKNKEQALFSIHGKKYLVGDFLREYEHIPENERELYKSFESKKKLIDQMIIRELLMEKTYDEMLDAKNKEQVEHLKGDILRQILHREEVDEKIEMTEDELKEFYEKNKHLYTEPPRVKISYVRIGEGNTGEERKKAQDKANQAYQRIKKGESFDEIAKTYSEDTWTASKGGRVENWISETDNPFFEMTAHTFHQNVLGLRIGEVSKPFTYLNSYYIVKVQDRREEKELTFEQARYMVESDYGSQKHQELTENLERELLEKSNLAINEDAVKEMVTQDRELVKKEEGEVTYDKLYEKALTAQEAGDFMGAVKTLNDLLKRYPKDIENDKILFMLGGIYSETLEDYEKARDAFERLVKEYPNSELVDDARWMLENMGKEGAKPTL